jgi:RNA polymerase sigma-70 factor (ECF subfamily)
MLNRRRATVTNAMMALRNRRLADGPDEALVRRWRRGDREALAELLHRHRALIASIVRRVTGEGAHLEDVMQDVMVAAIEAVDGFRGEAKLSTWLASVATRTALNWVNRHPESREVPLRDREGSVEADPAGTYERRESGQRLQEALDRLPPDQRAAVCLRHIEGLSVAEVAEALGVPVGTVKSRLHHARRQLRRAAVARPPTAHGR